MACAERAMTEQPPLGLEAFMSLSPAARGEAVRDDARGALTALTALGDACERLAAGSPKDAMRAGRAVEETARALGLGSAAARAGRALVAAHAYLGELEDAIACADAAAEIAQASGDAVESARARVASMHALAKLGRTDEAIARGAAARDALAAAGRMDLAARAELNLANVHKIRGESAEALAALERALAGVAPEDRAARGTILNTLGEALLQLDRLSEAMRAFDDADAALDGLPLARTIVLGNKADLLARQGRLGESIAAFARAAEAAKGVAPGHHARLLIEEAEALATLGAAREALAAASEALEVASARGLRAEAARARLVRARTLAAAARFTDADGEAMQALAISSEIGDVRGRRAATLMRAELALRAAEPARAHELAREASEDASPLDRARARAIAAEAHLLEGDARAARVAIDEATACTKDLGVRTVEIDLTTTAAACARALGEHDESQRLLAAAVETAEELRATIGAERHRSSFTASRLRVYEELALAELERGDRASLTRAFATVERARSRQLLETILRAVERTGAAAGAPDDELARLRAQLSELHARLARDGSDGGADGVRRGIAPALLDAMRRTERAIDDLVTARQAMHAPAGGVSPLLARVEEAAAVATRLAHGDALIAYFRAGDELMAFTIFEGEIACSRALAFGGEVDELVEKLLFQLRAPTDGAAPDGSPVGSRAIAWFSRALHDRVLAPILDERPDIDARATRLVVVPFGALHALPFALLSDGKRHLIERFEIQTAPSASIACPAAKTRSASGGALVVGVADAAAPLIDAEVDEIAAIAGARLLKGDAATRGALRGAAPSAAMIHLACHGRFVPSLPAASGLRLADGWLPIRDILDLGLAADLVVLSGCETGRHAVDAGDELSGIARAFHAAGARRLVTTLWSVRDRSALRLATRFHRALEAGCRPSRALRESTLALIAESAHPSCWAPFVLSGSI
jgi:tetratricopeptide (TPR) repeat protein